MSVSTGEEGFDLEASVKQAADTVARSVDDAMADVNDVITNAANDVVGKKGFDQAHEDLVLQEDWWWAVHLCLCTVAIIGNLLFIVTIIYNRKRQDLKSFATAIIVTIAVLDVVDIGRIIPVLVESLFDNEIFRHVYCSLGVFHELSVSVFLVSLAVAACVAAGRNEQKYYTGTPKASVPQKILIPIVLLISGGVAGPLFLLPYNRLAHSCTDPFRARHVVEGPPSDGSDASYFYSDLYSTIVSAVTYALPVLVLPLALPIACLRNCISKRCAFCCVPRFKQAIGELIMTIVICVVYLGSIVGVILPKLNEIEELENNLQSAKVIKAPLLWEIGNNAARPLVYFMTNPGVWDGLKSLCGCCCQQKGHHLVNGDDVEEAEIPLSPVTTV